jgi:hypothetical protein
LSRAKCPALLRAWHLQAIATAKSLLASYFIYGGIFMELKQFKSIDEMQSFFKVVGYTKTVERIITQILNKHKDPQVDWLVFMHIWNKTMEYDKDFLTFKKFPVSWIVINELRKEIKQKEA